MEGERKQILNLGLGTPSPSDATEWNVIVPDNVFLAEGQGWTLLPDDTLVITSTASNITLMHFDFPNSVDGNLPFYIEHYVALVTAAILAIAATLTIITKVRARIPKND
jgi:hypothetical protein